MKYITWHIKNKKIIENIFTEGTMSKRYDNYTSVEINIK